MHGQTDAARSIVTDVLVVGSGAGGLATAVTAARRGLKVVVAEKEPVFGGTTARSGGWLWVPANPHAAAAGFKDSAEAARRYLQHEAGNQFNAETVDAFLANAPKAITFFESETALQFELGPGFSDYHPEAPGAMAGGRSIVAKAYDARALGDEVKRLRPPLKEITFVGMMIGSQRELLHFFNVTRSVRSAGYVALLLARYLRDLAVHGRAMRLTNGNALAGRLAKSAFDAGVEIWTSAPVVRLIEADGRVTGAVVRTKDGETVVAARRGVVLAAGGFPWDVERRKAMFPHAPTGREHWSPAPEGNTGDGIRLAEAAGGKAVDGYPNAAAWVPVSRVPRSDGSHGVFPHFIDRGKPGVIAVTANGRRFVNEANSYHDFVQAMVAATPKGAAPSAWLICDHPTLRRYGLGFVKPFPVPLSPVLRSGYLKRGRTLRELAQTIGVDAAALAETVATLNDGAARGVDPEFNKGCNAYNRYLGDATVTPNPCVGPVATAPFYAVKVVPGDLGTFAGLRTSGKGEVLGPDGAPIAGLYAAGNDMASIMGGNYPGGGITLGPAITFGYIIGNALAGTAP
ncbi:MAG: FAD-dependent oxidoreductase [Hyphomicrobiaceae bacterium]|nr:FAD-dependent oxidoreductase [Hyphomicrobiaceae bacterium]